MKQITIYACKNTRKNAQTLIKYFNIYEGEGLKNAYTINDLYDLANFMVNAKNKGYGVFRMCVYDRNFAVRRFNDNHTSTIEPFLNEAYHYMRYMNLEEFGFSLDNLHNNENIRHHIHNFYRD